MVIKGVSIQLLIFISLLSLSGCYSNRDVTLLFVGSFTNGEPGEGIHVYEFNNETGESILKYTLDSVVNTSFQRISPDGKYLFSVVESQMPYNGKIASFKIDAVNKKIEPINTQDCGGRNPVHIEMDNTGTLLFNSNYTDPSLSLFKINDDGSLDPYCQLLKFKDGSVIKSRQREAHIHSSNTSPDNQYVFAQDLGADKIRRFKVVKGTTPKLTDEFQFTLDPGSGPRHFTFHPNGKFGYSLSELSGKITVFHNRNGNLIFIKDYASYRNKQELYRSADIHVSKDGNFLYASNRDSDEDHISIYSIDQATGLLNLVGYQSTYGRHPRNFAISPSGKFLLVANQYSNNIIVFRRDVKLGTLTKIQYEISVNSPSSIQMHTYHMP